MGRLCIFGRRQFLNCSGLWAGGKETNKKDIVRIIKTKAGKFKLYLPAALGVPVLRF